MKTFNIISSWNEVNLETYLKVVEIQTNEKLENLSLQKAVELIACLSDVEYDELLKMDKQVLGECINKLAFLNEETEDRSREPFEINGVNYMMLPNFDELTTGEMISIEQMILDASENSANYLADLLAVLVRPVHIEGDTITPEVFHAEFVDMRKGLLLKSLYVPFFLDRLTDFFLGSQTLEAISAQFTEQTKEVKERIRALVN